MMSARDLAPGNARERPTLPHHRPDAIGWPSGRQRRNEAPKGLVGGCACRGAVTKNETIFLPDGIRWRSFQRAG